MMRNGTPQIGATRRSLAMLDAVIDDGGLSNVSDLARACGIPVATAHRQVATLVAEGYLTRSDRGRHLAGPRLRRLIARIDEKQVVAAFAAPLLHRLASKVRSVVQLGTLEGGMVTYRLKTGRGAGRLFTRTDMQLEAYCSGIGKVLLAHLPHAEREAYLAEGPFIALTRATITDSAALRRELDRVREQGFACDRQEVAEDLSCVAVPITSPSSTVVAAISVSRLIRGEDRLDHSADLALLRETAAAIERAAFSP